jgi:hypothetical protein
MARWYRVATPTLRGEYVVELARQPGARYSQQLHWRLLGWRQSCAARCFFGASASLLGCRNGITLAGALLAFASTQEGDYQRCQQATVNEPRARHVARAKVAQAL